MRRIAVIGNGGGGKSTLTRALGQHLRISVHEVDEVQWLAGWRRAPLDELAQTLRRVHAMRPELLQLVTKSGRVAKLVHLRSPREISSWVASVTRTPVGVTG